jgi:hypothetical protein
MSASQIARITGVNHTSWQSFLFFFLSIEAWIQGLHLEPLH